MYKRLSLVHTKHDLCTPVFAFKGSFIFIFEHLYLAKLNRDIFLQKLNATVLHFWCENWINEIMMCHSYPIEKQPNARGI